MKAHMMISGQTYEYTQAAMNPPEIEDNITRRVVSALVEYTGIIPYDPTHSFFGHL